MLDTLLTVDSPYVSRVDRATLSEQTLMELLVGGMDDVGAFQHDGAFTEVKTWVGVQLDSAGHVLIIDWDRSQVDIIFGYDENSKLCSGGSIDLRWLPERLESFRISDMLLDGSLDTRMLPASLVVFVCDCNDIIGSFDVTGLPQDICNVSVRSNVFAGSLQLTQLPTGLQVLCLSDNNFTGSADLTNLPDGLEILELSGNQLSGEIDLRRIPPSMRSLSLELNDFAQDVLTVGAMPANLAGISVDEDKFSTIINIDGGFPTISQVFPGIFIERESLHKHGSCKR